MSRRGLSRLAPVALVLALGLSACGGSADDTSSTPSGGSSSSSEPVQVSVTRDGGTFTPNGERVDLAVGQTLDLTITSDVAGEFHVHSTPEQEIEYDAGTSEHEITIDRPGVVEVESHEPASVVLQLEVR